MRTLAFDGRMGASGDMLLGALLAAGADRAALAPAEAGLPISYAVTTTDRQGIAATAVEVVRDDRRDASHDTDEHGPKRRYGEVVDIVEGLDLQPEVESDVLSIFERLGEAEATVHGTGLAETYFHEVGADDAIADVVGTRLLLEDLAVNAIVTAPVAAGDGEVTTAHGTYPVPTPAVVELAAGADWTLKSGPVDAELLTPTGASVLAEMATGVESLPAMTVASSGYGAGSRDFEGRPNVLRAVVGEHAGSLDREPITVLETNVDDVSPELLGGLHETLADAGALDVSVVPTTMKKSRPGHLVRVVTAPADAERVAERLAAETGTLGIREHGSGHRWVADREERTVEVEIDGTVYTTAVKVGRSAGEVFDVSAEFDDALAIAQQTDRSVKDVMRMAERAARE